jgi:hypothetical protein
MSCCSQCGCALPGLEHLCQKCYEEKYPQDLNYIRSSLPRIDAQWRFWIGIAVDGVIAVVSLIGLFAFALNWSWKPFLPVMAVFWVMATLVRLHHHASRKTDVRARRPRLPDWCLGGFCISYSLAFNWLSSYCWFSPRYAFFSGPVLREMGLIVALNAAIAFFGAYLMGGNWRTAMGLFVFASYVLIRLMH